MNYPKSTYYSNVFRDFRSIDSEAYRELVEYFEANETEIRHLEFEEYFEIYAIYVDAVFMLENYQKYLTIVDELIERSMTYDVQTFRGEDVFQKALMEKAIANYHTFALENADHVLREIIRINPLKQEAILYLKKCLRRKKSVWLANGRAFSVFLFLVSAIVICIEILVVRGFYQNWLNEVMALRNILFFSGFFILGLGELLHYYQVNKEVDAFVALAKVRKNLR